MQSLLTLLAQWSLKAWVAVVVTVLSCGTATVFYFSSAKAGSSPTPGNPTVAVQAGQTGDLGHALGGAHCAAPPPAVPEANAGLTLIPVVAAVLWFSSRRRWPARAPLAVDGQNAQGALGPQQGA